MTRLLSLAASLALTLSIVACGAEIVGPDEERGKSDSPCLVGEPGCSVYSSADAGVPGQPGMDGGWANPPAPDSGWGSPYPDAGYPPPAQHADAGWGGPYPDAGTYYPEAGAPPPPPYADAGWPSPDSGSYHPDAGSSW